MGRHVQGRGSRRVAHISFLPETKLDSGVCSAEESTHSCLWPLPFGHSRRVSANPQVDTALVSFSPHTAVSHPGHYDPCCLLSTSFFRSLICLPRPLSSPLCTAFLGCVSTCKCVHARAHSPLGCQSAQNHHRQRA